MRKNINYSPELIDKMLKEGSSIRDIAAFYGVEHSTIRSWMKTHGYRVESRLVKEGKKQ